MSQSELERRQKTDKRRESSGLKTMRVYLNNSSLEALCELAYMSGYTKSLHSPDEITKQVKAEDISSLIMSSLFNSRKGGTSESPDLSNKKAIELWNIHQICVFRANHCHENAEQISSFLTTHGYQAPKTKNDKVKREWSIDKINAFLDKERVIKFINKNKTVK